MPQCVCVICVCASFCVHLHLFVASLTSEDGLLLPCQPLEKQSISHDLTFVQVTMMQASISLLEP